MRPAISPLELPIKSDGVVGVASTSNLSSFAETKGKTSDKISTRPVRHARKRKNKDGRDKTLEEFTSRRHKAKKLNAEKKTGLQLMITDYFLQAKATIKREQKQEEVKSVLAKDVLQDSRYDFDRSCVPQDDDLEIIDVVPGRDTDARKAIPFVHLLSSDEDVPMKKEPEDSDRPLTPKMEPLADIAAAAVIKEESTSQSTSNREMALMVQVENLSKGLEDMRNEMQRQKRVATTRSFAMKAHTKALKLIVLKKAIKSRFEKYPQKADFLAKVYPPVVEQSTGVQWEEVQDQLETKVLNVKEVEVDVGVQNSEGKPGAVAENSEHTQVTHSEAMAILCDSETMKDGIEYSQPEEKVEEVNKIDDKQSQQNDSDNENLRNFEPDKSDDAEEMKEFAEYYSHGPPDDEQAPTYEPQREDMKISDEGNTVEVDEEHVAEDQDGNKSVEVVREDYAKDGEKTQFVEVDVGVQNSVAEPRAVAENIAEKPHSGEDNNSDVLTEGQEVKKSVNPLSHDEVQNALHKSNDNPTDGYGDSSDGDGHSGDHEVKPGSTSPIFGTESHTEDIDKLEESMKTMDVVSNNDVKTRNEDEESDDNQLLGETGEAENLSELDDDDEQLLGSKAEEVDAGNTSSGESADNDDAVLQSTQSHSEKTDQSTVEKQDSAEPPCLPSFAHTFAIPGDMKTQCAGGFRSSQVPAKSSVAIMQSTIHPPGTNVEMQNVMKGRLPSTSESDTDIPADVQKVMMSRMVNTQMTQQDGVVKPIVEVATSQPKKQENVRVLQQCEEVHSVKPGNVLTTKDPNIMRQMDYTTSKWKPVDGGVTTAASSSPGTVTTNTQISAVSNAAPEEEHVERDVEGDPFFSGVHLFLPNV